MDNKLIILDGNSLINRAFYAIPLLSNRQGVFTNGVYGFTNMLFRIIEEEKPCHLAVAFDKTKAHVRIAEYAEYKANRKGSPEELRPQFSLAKDILRAMDVPVLELEGYEADDVIGTLVRKAEDRGWRCVIYTGDRDALQLISPLTTVALTKKGITEIDLVDEKMLQEKYGLKPLQITDLKGLMGDSSDNIPGVPGVGEKTALKLLSEFGSIENIYASLDKIAGKLQEKLRVNRELADLSKRLATILQDIPLEMDLESCALSEPDYPKLLEIFKELEFKNLIKTISTNISHKPEVLISIPTGFAEPQEIREITDPATLREFVNCLEEPVGMFLEYRGENARTGAITGIGLAGSNRVCAYLSEETLEQEEIWRELSSFFSSPTGKAVHDYKKAYSYLKVRGLELKAVEMDLMLAAYLINPLSGKYTLEDLAFEQLNLVLNLEQGYFAVRGSLVQQLALIYRGKLAEMDLLPLFTEVELPLARVLAKMELLGVKLDRTILDKMGVELSERLGILEDDIYGLAGERFNINSPQQLGCILFEKLGLPVLKKTKTGYSTSAEVLEELAPHHPVIEKILEYRQLAKLKSTYIEGLKGLQDKESGKVYTSFNQTITATGRLSSTEPNLQNIPIRLELGRQIRKAFVPSSPDLEIIAADYSQIELRILAHISGDKNLQAAFQQGEDIHTRTASEIFNVPLDEVTSDMRRKAKAVNFGIVYGIGDFSLSKDIGVSRKEARQYIDNYFARYPLVKKWIDDVIQEARDKGYVTTVYNRRRNLPDLFSSNKIVRAFGERTAMNTPIQGSAADVIKLAMVKLDEALKNYRARVLLQVHDELILEVPQDELTAISELLPKVMENAIPMAVKLKVDLKFGPNWYDLTKLTT